MQLCRRLLLLLILLGGLTFGYAYDHYTWNYDYIRVQAAAKDTAYAKSLLSSFHKRIDKFQMNLGVYPSKQINLIILPDRASYNLVTHGKGKLVEHSQAFYSPQEQIIYVRSPDQLVNEEYERVLMHEYIHWFLDNTMDNVPLWFHEGLAQYYSGQFSFLSYYELTRYRFLGYKLSLQDMVYGYPADRNYWDMFYLTSVFAVNYLDSRHNKEWQEFWNYVGYYYDNPRDRLSPRVDFISAFNYSFRMSLYTYSKTFDKALSRYSWQFPFIGINGLIFALLPFLVFFAWLKGRHRLRNMPDTEPEFLPEEEAEEDELLSSAEEQLQEDTQEPDSVR